MVEEELFTCEILPNCRELDVRHHTRCPQNPKELS
jgi:hypothetical protein